MLNHLHSFYCVLRRSYYAFYCMFRFKNYLGGWKVFEKYAFEILIMLIGIVALIIALCAVLFALGLLISIIQLTARIACNSLFSIDIAGQSVQSVCIRCVFNLSLCTFFYVCI